MADFARRECALVEYSLPRPVSISDLYGASAAAWREYCQRRGLDPSTARAPGDWAYVDATDGQVVIRFEAPTDLAGEVQVPEDEQAAGGTR